MHMRKIFRNFFALALVMLGALSASAAERISLQEVPFGTWDGWGADAQMTGTAECLFIIGEAAGDVYGDTKVNNYADLSLYSRLIVTARDGSPRFLFNRDVEEGQWKDKEEESHLIDNTKGGWSAKYFSSEPGENEGETVYYVDLKLLVKEKGFAHLHAIKGANWANVTIVSMEVERQGKAQQIGWTNLINNSDMEGDDVSSFFTKLNIGDNANKVVNSEIVDGAGVNESRGIIVATGDKTANDYDNQFWFRFNETVPAGTKYRVSFDYKADEEATPSTQAHAEPSDYIHYVMFGGIKFAQDWQTFTQEGEVTADQSKADKQFLSVAFNLNPDDHVAANKYYFDNIKFEVYKYGTTAEFSNDVILVDFGFDTNIPELVKASGKPRLMFPNDCATVKLNGKEAGIWSVEAFADGRFYIFLDSENGFIASSGDEVSVSFKNPADAAYHLLYTSGPLGDVNDFTDVIAEENGDIENGGGYPYIMVTPIVVSADPEDGSFNLPNSIREFKVNFDKNVDCAALVATLNGEALSVEPAEGLAENIVLKRNSEGDLPTGEYTIHLTKIYPEYRLADEIFGDTAFVVSIGKVEYDPNDVPEELIPAEYFANCSNGGIPEGFAVYFGEEIRVAPNTFGSGSRLFDFAAGGDFTKGLYFRDKYTEYGTIEEHKLALKAGKKYNIHFNSAAWKDNGMNMKFQVLNADQEVVLEQLIANAPNVNGSTGAVNGSTATDIKFFPEADGEYQLRWYPCSDNKGTEGGFNEVLLANVKVTYQPSQIGFEETQLLNTALENAKSTRDGNADERYAGEAFSALVAAIEKYEAEKEGYTNPSQYKNGAAALDAAAQAVKDHRQLCDNYDTQIKKAIDVVRQNEQPDGGAKPATKFTTTELFAQLKEVVAKYNGTSEWRDVADHSGEEEGGEVVEPNWQLFYEYTVLTDDAELTAAVKELTDIANVTSLLFTEGASTPEGSNNGKGTGVAVLIDRLRLGAEALKALGVAEDDWLVMAANNALTDDDELAQEIKDRITTIVYGNLKDADNTMFAPDVDLETLEKTTPTYDMTVFVKNPNIYKQQTNLNFTDENVPGWTTPEGFNRPGLTIGWGQPKNVEGIAEDCMFQTWGGSYRVEQTITDLPAGVYTIKMGFGERQDEKDAPTALDGTFIYAKTSDTPWAEEGQDEIFAATTTAERIGQAFPFATSQSALAIEGVVVTDGILTIGANAGAASHTFFNDVRLLITAPAAGFNYAEAYQEVLTGIEATETKQNTVRAIELYDLNGRRISSARQGIVLVKKYMSDGTVKTDKVVRK